MIRKGFCMKGMCLSCRSSELDSFYKEMMVVHQEECILSQSGNSHKPQILEPRQKGSKLIYENQVRKDKFNNETLC